jgi:hypothetical protein
LVMDAMVMAERGWVERGWAERGWAERGWAERGWVERGWVGELLVALGFPRGTRVSTPPSKPAPILFAKVRMGSSWRFSVCGKVSGRSME